MVGNYDVLKEEFIPISKVKKILDEIAEKTYEQKLAFEHVKRFAKTKPEKVEAIVKDLVALEMRRLKEEHIIKIVDLMPKDMDDLKTIFAGVKPAFKEEELEKIIEIVKKHEKWKKWWKEEHLERNTE